MRERRASRLKPFREASGPPYPGSSRPRRLFLVGVRIDLVGNPGLANADRVLLGNHDANLSCFAKTCGESAVARNHFASQRAVVW